MTDRRYTRGFWGERSSGRVLGWLYADEEEVVGDVKIAFRFDEQNGVAKADLLSDWIGLLQKELDLHLLEMRKELQHG